MLVHRRSFPGNLLGFPQQFAGTHLHSWVERGTVRVKCLVQGSNPDRSLRNEYTNHEAYAPPFYPPRLPG